MTPAFRSTAMAAALAAISCGAMAEEIKEINFDNFWDASIEASDPPKAVGPSDIKGFLFSTDSAWAYKKEMLKPGITADNDVLPAVWDIQNPGNCKGSDAECNFTGFIMNRTRGKGGNVIDISLDPAVFGSRYITNITLDLFHNADSGKIIAIAGNEFADLPGFTGGSTEWIRKWDADLTGLSFRATTLRFDFGDRALALDNLNFKVSGSSDPDGTVPEPASYALVGLALLAAGATRRRKA